MSTIDIDNTQDTHPINTDQVETWAIKALELLDRDDAELSIVIVDDNYIRELNKQYLDRDRPTNVISFPQQEGPGPLSNHLGDIVISADTADSEAKGAGLTFDTRLFMLVIHGICHLCGYNHEDVPEEKALEMETVEKDLFEKIIGNE